MFVLYFIGMGGGFKRPVKKQGGPRTFGNQVVLDLETYNSLLVNRQELKDLSVIHQELKETVVRMAASQTGGSTCS